MQKEEGHLGEVKILAEYAVDMCKHVWGSELDYELTASHPSMKPSKNYVATSMPTRRQ